MKRFLALTLALLIVMTMAACGGSGGKAADPNTLVVWHDKEAAVIEALQTYLDKALPDITVRFEKKTSLTDSLKLVGNDPSSAPDLFVFAHDKIGVFAEMGILTPVTELISQRELSGYLPMTLEAATYNGGLYQLPLYFETMLFMYNRRYMQDEEAPTTTEELLAYMPKLDTANPAVREYFCEVGRYWVKNFHIDGWRLDVASEVDDGFWRAFRKAVKEIDPDVLLIGEVWESAGHWLQGDMFDSTMNYDFRKHCNLFFAEQSIDASDFAGRITDMLMRYRMQMTPAQMNLLDSHDVSRFLSLCGGDMRRYRLAILFMMTFVGMPTVFYGDELGVQGLSEEEYRCPMPWDNENSTLCTFFKEAIAMRKKLEPLRCGDFRVVSAERGSGLIIYAREYCNQRVTICINRGGKAVDLDEEYGKLHWSEGLDHRKLCDHGFAVFVDGQC